MRNRGLVLVANEPRSYRETFAAAIDALRPGIEVVAVEPEVLDQEIPRSFPDAVICSRTTQTVRERVRIWVEIHPEGDMLSVVSVGGRQSTVVGLDLPGLLSILDRIEPLAHSS